MQVQKFVHCRGKFVHCRGKFVHCGGKFHHITGHEGPEVEQKYSSTLSLTSALDGGGGHEVAQLVEALCYRPEGRRFDSQWCHWNFSST